LRCFLRIGGTGDLAYRNLDGTERIEVVTPEVLFAKDSIDSFKMKPITYPHPPVKVRSDNVMQYGRGMLGHYAVIDGDFLGFVGTVADKQAVDALLSGTATEASCGYDTATRLRGDGKFEQVRRDGNHVAIVPRGRAGSDVRFHVDGAEEFEYWYQIDAPTDLYNADSDTVREVFKDIQQRHIYDFKPRSDVQEQSTKPKAKDRSMMISFPSGRVFNVDDEDLAAEILALLADDDDDASLAAIKGMGYGGYMDAAEALKTLKTKVDAAEGTATGLRAQVTELQTKLDAAAGSRMDADQIAAEVSSRADAWSAVLPLLRMDTPDFQPDYKLDVAEVRKLAIAKKVPHLNLDGKSAEFINAVWETIAPGLKQIEQRRDSSDDLLAMLNLSQRTDAPDPMTDDAKESARKKQAARIEGNGKM